MYVCTRMLVCACMCACVYMYVCTRMLVCACMCACVYMYVCTCMLVCACMCACVYISVCTRMLVCARVCVMYVCMCVYTYACTRMLVCACLCARAHEKQTSFPHSFPRSFLHSFPLGPRPAQEDGLLHDELDHPVAEAVLGEVSGGHANVALHVLRPALRLHRLLPLVWPLVQQRDVHLPALLELHTQQQR